jgi:hypothetical protein
MWVTWSLSYTYITFLIAVVKHNTNEAFAHTSTLLTSRTKRKQIRVGEWPL